MSSNYFSLLVLVLMNIVVYRAIFKKLLVNVNSIRNFLKEGKLVKGTVVGYTTELDLDQHKMYAPVVEFFVEDKNMKCEIKSDDFSFTKVRLNSSVDVCYKFEAPSEAIINPHKNLTLKIITMALVVLLMAALNVGIIFKIFSH
ncbi:MAG: hypothetical protein KF862_18305 [Chitinophagaceae bacterium]|nr:hypothetical protein [Chitinophagaceae bacterium]